MIGFVTPAILGALILLPAIWWLLRVTPPAPRLVRFPAIRLLRDLVHREETPARTPLWLILMRLLLATLLIVALAGPILRPSALPPGRGPEVIVVDTGWAAANNWAAIKTALLAEIERDQRADMSVVLVPTARNATGNPVDALGPMPPAEAKRTAEMLEPMPWGPDRAAAAQILNRFDGRSSALWLSDGIASAGMDALAAAVAGFTAPRMLTPGTAGLPQLLMPPEIGPDLILKVRRAAVAPTVPLTLVARGEDGRVLGEATGAFNANEPMASVRFDLPAEVRNQVARIDLAGIHGVGGTVLLDERWRRRPVAIVTPPAGEVASVLLSSTFYIQRALAPFAEVRTGDIDTLLKGQPAVLVLTDDSTLRAGERRAIQDWLAKGGLLLRFAGPKLAASDPAAGDDLLPTELRTGGRSLSGAMSWTEPAALAPFPDTSPFFGLDIAKEVTVSRQILAEPGLDLDRKVWARLADGTPLITADKREAGTVVLVHTSADPSWSNLSLSGLFPQMLRRIVAYSAGISRAPEHGVLEPYRVLDGLGRLHAPGGAAAAITADRFDGTTPEPQHPPGYYGETDSRRALNLTQTVTTISPLDGLPMRLDRQEYAAPGEVSLAPWFLAAVLALAAIDTIVALWLGGSLPKLPRPGRRLTGGSSMAGLAFVMAVFAFSGAMADTPTGDKTADAAAQVTLGYVVTGDAATDRISKAGLAGLAHQLILRTSIDHAAPAEVDLEKDELSVYPLLYWPISATAQPLSDQAREKLNRYLSTGGMILIDTKAGAGDGRLNLGKLIQGIDVPTLTPVPPGHVLTKSFYLLDEFPGRVPGGEVWVERDQDARNDGVSSVVVGSADWAGAWAVDATSGMPLFNLSPGGERQREWAYRFGVNLVMYALTGNYKSDLVHAPFIQQRLGTMNGAMNLAFAPQLPWLVLGPLITLAVLALAAAFAGNGRGRWWRLVLLSGIALALIQPSIVREQRDPVKDVAVVVVDRSPSQHFAGRTERTEQAVAALKTELSRFPDLETRVVESDNSPVGEETDLFSVRADTLSDVPRNRVAGTFLITDGEVHDVPKPASLENQGPVHVLLTGARDERDRRIEVIDAPGYGIVGNKVTVKLRITDANIPPAGAVPLKITQDAGAPRTVMAQPGEEVAVDIPIDHGGPSTVEMEAAPAEGELTQTNNRAVVVINGVRERLRVLLISGEPHAGERTWRNLLKSDPSVDLVHFTILRPPEKNDGTPFNELSLIAFPIAELFDVRLHEFDLIIFDHYQQMLLLPEYYQNLANYVRKGGALLEASGPGFEGSASLFHTALRDVLPGAPTGREIDLAFQPKVTELGERHPVTTALPGDNDNGPPGWGSWFRQGEVSPVDPGSNVVMTGAENKPLLLLAHAGEGRVAQLASDQIWLWSRGFEGGGPQAELLRRLAHWLMKEPELDENQLTASAKSRQITITRRALRKPTEPVAVSVTDPNGVTRQVTLDEGGHGVAKATIPADAIGLYKVNDGVKSAFAVIGSIDTPELRDVLTTESRLEPVVTATGGTALWLADGDRLDIRRVDADGPTGGRGWMGLRRNGQYMVRGVSETPLLPVALLLIVLGGALGLAWFREGR